MSRQEACLSFGTIATIRSDQLTCSSQPQPGYGTMLHDALAEPTLPSAKSVAPPPRRCLARPTAGNLNCVLHEAPRNSLLSHVQHVEQAMLQRARRWSMFCIRSRGMKPSTTRFSSRDIDELVFNSLKAMLGPILRICLARLSRPLSCIQAASHVPGSSVQSRSLLLTAVLHSSSGIPCTGAVSARVAPTPVHSLPGTMLSQ